MIIFIFCNTDPVIVDQILNRVKNERISHKSLTFSYVKTKTSEDAIEICYWHLVLFVTEMFSLYQEMCQKIFDTLRFTMTRTKSYKLMKLRSRSSNNGYWSCFVFYISYFYICLHTSKGKMSTLGKLLNVFVFKVTKT